MFALVSTGTGESRALLPCISRIQTATGVVRYYTRITARLPLLAHMLCKYVVADLSFAAAEMATKLQSNMTIL